MHGHSSPTAHANAINESNVRLLQVAEIMVERILPGEETASTSHQHQLTPDPFCSQLCHVSTCNVLVETWPESLRQRLDKPFFLRFVSGQDSLDDSLHISARTKRLQIMLAPILRPIIWTSTTAIIIGVFSAVPSMAHLSASSLYKDRIHSVVLVPLSVILTQ